MKHITCMAALLVALGAGNIVLGDTVAYWRFEEGPANANVPHTLPNGQFEGTVPDTSGNGNSLSAWSQGDFAGYQYRADVPFASVPKTGVADNFSVKNTGGAPGMFTNSSVSAPSGVNVETMLPTAFTIETSWKPEAGGYRTVVGRDAQNVVTGTGALAALYLQAQPDNSLAIKFADVAGNFHQAVTAPDFIHGYDFATDPDGINGTWYNIAAVSDGSTLNLYVNGNLEATSAITSADPRLAVGTTSGGDWHAGGWSVGRGLFGGGHTDRGYGFIDEVRISNAALTPSNLLYQPAPTLQLIVNTTTGAVKLKNVTASTLNVDFYRIASQNSALSFANWNSLDDQNVSAVDGTDGGSTAGDTPGEGWDEGGGSNNSQLIEYFLANAGASIAAGQELSLGNAFNKLIFGNGVNGDLDFSFGLAGGQLKLGNVLYVSGSVPGDYNGNGVVDAADFSIWRDTFGSTTDLRANGDNSGASAGKIDLADFNYWKTRFGNTSGSGGGASASTAVPEPSVFALVTSGLLVLTCGRRKRG